MSVNTLEALQHARALADCLDAGLGSTRPCIAAIFYEGVTQGEGRGTYLHVLAVEFCAAHGLRPDKIERLLHEWNTRVSPPLAYSEIKKVIRRIERPGIWPYSCGHPMLAAWCIEDCPNRTNKNRWKGHAVSEGGLTCSGWIAHLTGAQTKVFLGLYRLARLKRRGPRANVPFTFRELQKASGVDRHHHRKQLEALQKNGLLAELTISNVRGQPSTFRFPTELPPPNNYRGK